MFTHDCKDDITVAVFSQDKSGYLQRIRNGRYDDLDFIYRRVFGIPKKQMESYKRYYFYDDLHEYEKNKKPFEPTFIRMDANADLYIGVKPLTEEDQRSWPYSEPRVFTREIQYGPEQFRTYFQIYPDFFIIKMRIEYGEVLEFLDITPETFELIRSHDSDDSFLFDLDNFLKQYKEEGYCK